MTDEPPPIRPVRRPGSFDPVISVLAFVAGNRLGGLGLAIALATAWSLKAAFTRRRHHEPIGKLLPITTGYLIVRGAIGIALDSKAVYFGIGMGTKVAIGLVLVGSVIARRDLIGRFAPVVLPFPSQVLAHPVYRSTTAQLTLAAGAYQLASAGWDLWLYNNASTDGFVVIRLLVGFVGTFVALLAALAFADWRLRRIEGFEGMLPLVESAAASLGGRSAQAD